MFVHTATSVFNFKGKDHETDNFLDTSGVCIFFSHLFWTVFFPVLLFPSSTVQKGNLATDIHITHISV